MDMISSQTLVITNLLEDAVLREKRAQRRRKQGAVPQPQQQGRKFDVDHRSSTSSLKR